MVTSSIIAAYLGGLEFPATKEQLVTYAEGRNAPKNVLASLKKMRGGTFYTIAGVWDAVDATKKAS